MPRRLLSPCPGSVEREHVHPPLTGGVEERVRPRLLEGVTAGDVEDQRRCASTGAQVQVAGEQLAIPGNVDVLYAVRGQGDHLLVAAAHASIEIALLGVVLENDVLSVGVLDGSLEVEIERRLAVAGSGLRLGQRLEPSRLQPHVLADHVVAAHALGQAPSALALEMEDLAGLLDQVVQHPLLTVPRERRPAADRRLCACHTNDPPCVLVYRFGDSCSLPRPRPILLATMALQVNADFRYPPAPDLRREAHESNLDSPRPPKLLDRVREANRLHHGSRSTEKSASAKYESTQTRFAPRRSTATELRCKRRSPVRDMQFWVTSQA
jgi:hypothetical protein